MLVPSLWGERVGAIHLFHLGHRGSRGKGTAI